MRRNGQGFSKCDNSVRAWIRWKGKGFSQCDNSVRVCMDEKKCKSVRQICEDVDET
jgi:hypothetical protein